MSSLQTIEFYKYQGTGNDFVMIDNRQKTFPKETSLIAHLCNRRFGIGADGLILLENADNYDFKMIYYNADGNESSMCGNGGRCIVAFAKQLKIIDNQAIFIAIDGEHQAYISSENEVKLKMKDVDSVEVNDGYLFLNTGSPHHVEIRENLSFLDVKDEGAKIRYSHLYAERGGSNINFVSQNNENTFTVRTYERGIEDETLSCGTGVTAVAIAMHYLQKTFEKKIYLQTMGGNLSVLFDNKEDTYTNVYLCGKATFVFKGSILCKH
ncbi:diaminopimelate epimerase [Capnocytophaga canimorsus]|uniref:diaminopimelate epimerase n=1 Tax=Capnocytophaga canimorsus TaxID=28188 RepID=UPI001EDFF141|nr:diaminopimelate epimerase [Capnocytophaga canimorsus]GJQ03998.1 diaminopimelate epimerase [Capnocytophaga canimorsus]